MICHCLRHGFHVLLCCHTELGSVHKLNRVDERLCAELTDRRLYLCCGGEMRIAVVTPWDRGMVIPATSHGHPRAIVRHRHIAAVISSKDNNVHLMDDPMDMHLGS